MAARAHSTAPRRFTATTRSKSAMSSASEGAGDWKPALLTRTSTPPSVAIASATKHSTAVSSATSPTAMPCGPLGTGESEAKAARRAGPSLRSFKATRPPSWAKRRATARPIPCAAPVTSTRNPSSPRIVRFRFRARGRASDLSRSFSARVDQIRRTRRRSARIAGSGVGRALDRTVPITVECRGR
jgi:hypothetical protein